MKKTGIVLTILCALLLVLLDRIPGFQGQHT